ncbi:Wzz/FepE/Etk N-terminal domain-containing protein [Thalassotalea piscium]
MKQFVLDDDVLSISSFLGVFWRWKWLIIVITTLSAGLSAFYAISQPDVYRAHIIAVTPDDKGGNPMSALSGQLGGLAGIAGISLGGSSDKKLEQIKELIRSRSFLQGFIEKHGLVVDILAAIDWDKAQNRIIYDETLYDEKNHKWVRTPPPGKAVVPTAWEAYPVLLTKINSEALVKKNMFKLSVDHFSPYKAKEWTELLLSDINELYRIRSKEEAENSISYLKGALEKTNIAEVKTMFYGLLEDQIKGDMLSEVRKEFALETYSHAVLPEDKDHPKRAMICIIGTLLGGIFSLIIVLIVNYFVSSRQLNK